MTESEAALSRTVEAAGKALLLLVIALLIVVSALAAATMTLTAILLLLVAYTLAGLVYYARSVTSPSTGPVALPDAALSGTVLGQSRSAFRSAGQAIAQALCVLTSLLSLWLVVGWIGQTAVTYPRLVYGLSCLLPVLLLLARRGQTFGALLLGGLATLALLAILIYAPPILVPIVFAAVHALSLLTAYRHVSSRDPGHSPTEVSDGQQQAALR